MDAMACRLWQAQMKGVKLAASVPRGISAESGRRLFQALVPLASTPLEVCPTNRL